MRRLIILGALAAAAVMTWSWGPAAWRDARTAYWKRQCKKYTAPPNQVVYAQLYPPLQVGPPDPPGVIPNCWTQFSDASQNEPAPLFLHERSEMGQEPQLVCVFSEGWNNEASWQFNSYLYRRGGMNTFTAPTEVAVPETGTLRFFAGQCDPSDSSHFTIGYEIHGEKGIIDGWLRGQTVKIQVRDGPAKPGSSRE